MLVRNMTGSPAFSASGQNQSAVPSFSQPIIVGIAIRRATYSYGLIRERGEFTVNFATADMVRVVDAIGHCTGRSHDKFAEFRLTPLPSKHIVPPLIDQCPVGIECRVRAEHEVGDHQLFLADVLAEHVDEDIVKETTGGVEPRWLDILVYARDSYFATGPWLGELGMSRQQP